MSTVGIIAEFNPLHKGHQYLISEAKKKGTVVAVISGNFVQRGDTAIAEKRIRAKAALIAGADIVLELPVLWSMSTAQNFALGGVSALKFAGCDTLMFGSECGNTEALLKTAEILNSTKFQNLLETELKGGTTFAKARQIAAEKSGAPKGILEGANNNLAIEYILSSKSLGADFKFETVKRKGAAHDSAEIGEFVSASLLREKLHSGDREFCNQYMPQNIAELFSCDNISDIKRIDTAIISALRLKSLEEFKNLPDLSEGIENKLYSAIRVATSLEGLYNEIKVKRYTLARIRRLVLSAVLGADNTFFMKPVPYIRVLGFNKEGEAFLREQISKSPVPVILRASEFKNLPHTAQRVFETECRATDLFSLSLAKPQECGIEYKAKLLKGQW